MGLIFFFFSKDAELVPWSNDSDSWGTNPSGKRPITVICFIQILTAGEQWVFVTCYSAGGLKMTFVSTEATTCRRPVPLPGGMADSESNPGTKSAGLEHTGPFVMLGKPYHNLKFAIGNTMKSHLLGTNRRNPFTYFFFSILIKYR